MAGARPIFFVSEGAGRRARGRTATRTGREAAPSLVPPIPAADTCRAARSGSCGQGSDRSHPRGPAPPRVPLLRTARDRQDVHGADPGQDGQLRERSHRGAVQRLRAVRCHPRGNARGRRRDRRRFARRGRRCSGASRESPDRADGRSREGLHHRRGAAAVTRGVRRAAEALRGAAARCPVRPRHDGATQDAGHDRRTVPAVRLPAPHDRRARPDGPDDRLVRRCRAGSGGGARDRAPSRRLGARCALAAGPGHRARWPGRRRSHGARLARRSPTW